MPIDTNLESVPKPGDVIGEKYRVERVLGKGGMGIVLAATHLQLEETVAIKILLPALLTESDVVARFVQEGRAAIKIRGEHVARVLDVGTLEGGLPYIVMEYLQGTDLDALVRRAGPMPVSLTVDYVLQACEALAEAHGRGFIHRDLKPANLFLTTKPDGSPSIKVLDFGISKNITPESPSQLTHPRAVLGSPRYMAPEQMRSARGVDARTDIWALGAILHELLAGHPPFDAPSIQELTICILEEQAPPLTLYRRDVPDGLAAAIKKCLTKDPAKRFASVAELALAIARYGSRLSADAPESIARILASASARRSDVPRQALGLPSFSTAETVPSMPPVGRTGEVHPGNSTSAWGATSPLAWRRPVRRTYAYAAGISALMALALLVGGLVHRAGTKGPVVPSAAAGASLPPAAVDVSHATVTGPQGTAAPPPAVPSAVPGGGNVTAATGGGAARMVPSTASPGGASLATPSTPATPAVKRGPNPRGPGAAPAGVGANVTPDNAPVAPAPVAPPPAAPASKGGAVPDTLFNDRK